MINTCVFETKDKRCIKSSYTSFDGVICDFHLLKIFGLEANAKSFDGPDNTAYIGPYLNLAPSVAFESNTVIFPSRAFLDHTLALDVSNAVAPTVIMEKYRLNPEMDFFMRNLMFTKSNNSNHMFQFEVARNLMTVNPSSDVNMSLHSDDVKSMLKTDCQTRLTNLKSNIENSPYYKFCEDRIEVTSYSRGVLPKGKLSAFEYFILFNSLPDRTKYTDNEYRPHTLNFNLIHIENVGFVTTRKICSPMDIVFCAQYLSDQRYVGWKVRKELKRIAGKRMVTSRLADSQNTARLVEQRLC